MWFATGGPTSGREEVVWCVCSLAKLHTYTPISPRLISQCLLGLLVSAPKLFCEGRGYESPLGRGNTALLRLGWTLLWRMWFATGGPTSGREEVVWCVCVVWRSYTPTHPFPLDFRERRSSVVCVCSLAKLHTYTPISPRLISQCLLGLLVSAPKLFCEGRGYEPPLGRGKTTTAQFSSVQH
jgi:hypothetical protein